MVRLSQCAEKASSKRVRTKLLVKAHISSNAAKQKVSSTPLEVMVKALC